MTDLTLTELRRNVTALFGAMLLSALCLTAAGGADAAYAVVPVLA